MLISNSDKGWFTHKICVCVFRWLLMSCSWNTITCCLRTHSWHVMQMSTQMLIVNKSIAWTTNVKFRWRKSVTFYWTRHIGFFHHKYRNTSINYGDKPSINKFSHQHVTSQSERLMTGAILAMQAVKLKLISCTKLINYFIFLTKLWRWKM